MEKPDLSAAFAIRTPAESRAHYRRWAARYDTEFAGTMEYRLPAHVAAAFVAHRGSGPVLDVGAGTGLLGTALRDQGFAGEIDGIDAAPEMLALAATKGCYRALSQVDVTGPLTLGLEYRGVVSSGTFTEGHVGPEALPGLIGIAAPGALFAFSVNLRVWQAAGWAAALDALGARIDSLSMVDAAVYGAAAAAVDDKHAGDVARIVVFRRL